MKRWWPIALVLLAVLGTISIAILARSNHRETYVANGDSTATSAAEPRRSQKHRLTSAVEEKIILGNITTVPFQELYDLLAKRNPEEIAALARQLGALPPGALTNAKITAFFKVWAALDAKSAFATGAAFADREVRDRAVIAVMNGVAPSSAGEVVHALLELPEGALTGTDSLLSQGLVKWSEADPGAAAEILDLAYNDPGAAIEWARSLPLTNKAPWCLLS